MIDKPTNGWLEKYIRDSFKRNDEVHADIQNALVRLQAHFDAGCRSCAASFDHKVAGIETRVTEIEKIIENFRGRFLVIVAVVGAGGALIARLISYIIEREIG